MIKRALEETVQRSVVYMLVGEVTFYKRTSYIGIPPIGQMFECDRV